MIRRATRMDAVALAALCRQLGYPTTAEQVSERLAAFDADGSSPVWVYEDTGRVVAWMQVRESATLESGGSAEIVGLVVDASRRGAGLGAALVAFARRWALERGHSRLRVRTNQTRTGTHAFYERLGFTLTKVQRVYDASF